MSQYKFKLNNITVPTQGAHLRIEPSGAKHTLGLKGRKVTHISRRSLDLTPVKEVDHSMPLQLRKNLLKSHDRHVKVQK